MNNSIFNESFYTNLNSIIQTKIQEVYKAQQLCRFYSIISIALYIVLGSTFIYMLRDVLFIPNYFFDLNLLFNFCKVIIIISGAIFVISYINKQPKENYKRLLLSLQELLNKDICTCNSKCNCKNSVIIYLGKQGINLLL